MKAPLRNAFTLASLLIWNCFDIIDAAGKIRFVKLDSSRKLKKVQSNLFHTKAGKSPKKNSYTSAITNASTKASKGKGGKANNFFVNAVDGTGACPLGTKIELIEVATQKCVQSVATTASSCSCSLAIPLEAPAEDYCIKVEAPGSICSGDIGASCITYLNSTTNTEFCVQLQPAPESSASSGTASGSNKKNGKKAQGKKSGSSSSTSSSNSSTTTTISTEYHQTSIIAVTYSNQTCMSEAVVELYDCETLETKSTFTTTSTNCATSFNLPSSEKHFCIKVDSPDYSCGGSMSSNCVSGPIEMPVLSQNVTKYEVIMQSVLGIIELGLTYSENSSTKTIMNITYSLIDDNASVVATEVSDCHGVTFSDVTIGTYSIIYEAISGMTCGGSMVNENMCQTEQFVCTSGNTTTITYTIAKFTSKPNKPPTMGPATDSPVEVPMVPPVPETLKPSSATAKPVSQTTPTSKPNQLPMMSPATGSPALMPTPETLKPKPVMQTAPVDNPVETLKPFTVTAKPSVSQTTPTSKPNQPPMMSPEAGSPTLMPTPETLKPKPVMQTAPVDVPVGTLKPFTVTAKPSVSQTTPTSKPNQPPMMSPATGSPTLMPTQETLKPKPVKKTAPVDVPVETLKPFTVTAKPSVSQTTPTAKPNQLPMMSPEAGSPALMPTPETLKPKPVMQTAPVDVPVDTLKPFTVSAKPSVSQTTPTSKPNQPPMMSPATGSPTLVPTQEARKPKPVKKTAPVEVPVETLKPFTVTAKPSASQTTPTSKPNQLPVMSPATGSPALMPSQETLRPKPVMQTAPVEVPVETIKPFTVTAKPSVSQTTPTSKPNQPPMMSPETGSPTLVPTPETLKPKPVKKTAPVEVPVDTLKPFTVSAKPSASQTTPTSKPNQLPMMSTATGSPTLMPTQETLKPKPVKTTAPVEVSVETLKPSTTVTAQPPVSQTAPNPQPNESPTTGPATGSPIAKVPPTPDVPTVVVTVEIYGTPATDVQVDFSRSETSKIVESFTTNAKGQVTFSSQDNNLTYIGTITPPVGFGCKDSTTCTFEIVLQQGQITEYNVVLVELQSTSVITVVLGDSPASGAQVDIFVVSGNKSEVIESCKTSTEGTCTFAPKVTEAAYTATVIPPTGTTCVGSCSIKITLTPGQTSEYTMELDKISGTSVITVSLDGTPTTEVPVDFFITGEPNKVVDSCKTSTEGTCIFAPKDTEVAYTATVIPPTGTTCVGSCSIKITLTPGQTSEYTVELEKISGTSVITVSLDGTPTSEIPVDFFITGEPNKVVDSCKTSTEGTCIFAPKVTEVSYTATVIPPTGTTCVGSCSIKITLTPGQTSEYNVELEKISGTSVITVSLDGTPTSEIPVDFFITGEPNKVVDSCKTSTEGTCTFAPKDIEVAYTATVIPPTGTTCVGSCSIKITLTPGQTSEYTVELKQISGTAVITVSLDGTPTSEIQVDFFITGNSQSIEDNTTSNEGTVSFSPEDNGVSYTATITPSEGTKCEDSCSIKITLTPGKTSEYVVKLTRVTATLDVTVEYQGDNVPGAQVQFSTPENILESCATSDTQEKCSLTTHASFDVPYMSTLTPPEGYSCPESGCSAKFNLIAGKTMTYTFVLIKEQILSGEAVVTVLTSEDCVAGAHVDIYDPENPSVILQTFTTTSSVCQVTFTTVNVNIMYQATVTPPNNSYLCSGDFDGSCTATFNVMIVNITYVRCILTMITPSPITQKPSKGPTIAPQPTPRPTKKPVTKSPTKKPVTNSPTKNPTSQPTKEPTTLKPTPSPTKKPVTKSPTKNPTSQPTKKPTTLKPTPSPTKKPVTKEPMQNESANGVGEGDKKWVKISNDKGNTVTVESKPV